MSRTKRFVFAAVVATVVVLAAATPAMARSTRAVGHRGHGGQASLPFKVSTPSVPQESVIQGVAFDATGVIAPAVSSDGTPTAAMIEVYQFSRRGPASLVATPVATLTGPDADGNTPYSVSITLPTAGQYALVTVLTQGDAVVGRSRPRYVRAILPYTVSKPHVASMFAVQGIQFDATGSIAPAIPGADPSYALALQVLSRGRHGASQVATADATFTGLDADGNTGYTASLSLPSAGSYSIVAVLTHDGVVVGRSKAREMVAKLPYVVSRPRVASFLQTAGTPFDATGTVKPALAPDDTSTTVAIQVFKLGRHARPSRVATVDGGFTGLDADGNTSYSASITIADAGRYALVTVVSRDGIVIGRSCARYVAVQAAVPPVTPPTTATRH